MKRLLSILLVLCFLTATLAGCSVFDVVRSVFPESGGITASTAGPEETDPAPETTDPTEPYVREGEAVSFRDMEYIHPDMDAHAQLLEQCCDTVKESEDLDTVLAVKDTFYAAYDRIAASYSLANIHACADTTSTYWQEELAHCAQAVVAAETSMEEFYCALALSPVVEELEKQEEFYEGFFDYYRYQGSADKRLQAYFEEEAALVEQYTGLFTQLTQETFYAENTGAMPLAELLAELIALRQEMAAYVGYDSYPEMAYYLYHYRSYTPTQAKTYLTQVGAQMSQLYRQTFYSPHWNDGLGTAASETYAMDYLDSATRAMGGKLRAAFTYMQENQLYDNDISATKRGVSFETYIFHYNQPYLFTSPQGTRSDALQLTHEFGHFANDWLLNPSYVGTDVAEVQSQGMEYLSLFYADDGEQLRDYKLLDCLSTYVEQAAFSLFEHRMYELKGSRLTPENLQALFLEIGNTFGFDCWQQFTGWEFTTVSHMYESPLYLISYVVSNDLAFQLYQLELKEPGAGLAVYHQCLESEASYLLQFAREYGLEDPFSNGRLLSVSRTLEKELKE